MIVLLSIKIIMLSSISKLVTMIQYLPSISALLQFNSYKPNPIKKR